MAAATDADPTANDQNSGGGGGGNGGTGGNGGFGWSSAGIVGGYGGVAVSGDHERNHHGRRRRRGDHEQRNSFWNPVTDTGGSRQQPVRDRAPASTAAVRRVADHHHPCGSRLPGRARLRRTARTALETENDGGGGGGAGGTVIVLTNNGGAAVSTSSAGAGMAELPGRKIRPARFRATGTDRARAAVAASSSPLRRRSGANVSGGAPDGQRLPMTLTAQRLGSPALFVPGSPCREIRRAIRSLLRRRRSGRDQFRLAEPRGSRKQHHVYADGDEQRTASTASTRR